MLATLLQMPQRIGPVETRSLIGWLILGLLAGWLAGKISRGRGFGCITDIVLGLIGGVLGGWIFTKPLQLRHLTHFLECGSLVYPEPRRAPAFALQPAAINPSTHHVPAAERHAEPACHWRAERGTAVSFPSSPRSSAFSASLYLSLEACVIFVSSALLFNPPLSTVNFPSPPVIRFPITLWRRFLLEQTLAIPHRHPARRPWRIWHEHDGPAAR